MTRPSPPPPSSALLRALPPRTRLHHLRTVGSIGIGYFGSADHDHQDEVWCISVQQLEASVVEDGVTPLLNAIVYALDNPFGSLSTTFEAVQDLIDGVLLLKDVNRKSYRWMFTVRIARIWEYMSTDPIEFYSSIHWHTG